MSKPAKTTLFEHVHNVLRIADGRGQRWGQEGRQQKTIPNEMRLKGDVKLFSHSIA
jgi:hypothetical protein